MKLTDFGLALATMVNGQRWTPPHYIMGYQLGEWASIATIVIFVSGLIVGIVRIGVVNPAHIANENLQHSIDRLTAKIEGIGENSDAVHKEHDKRLDAHDIKLGEHEIEIKNLKEKIEK
ncbi:hypothetical protein C5Z25_00065 [Lactobacillus sp. CBA3605]|uniref:hypothetical protein n=1 Tax=Lactobacillus sp. CBA3605 TaxID=2099788 RepID=UPI000CFB3C3C|nr:hypothetical protein [Lactobacillus sp. CBA3605]AVK60263.1 hypothetical protein C5Z25_00065 [Lactobacillus sp. CBA3605]